MLNKRIHTNFFVSRYHLYFLITSLYRGRELEISSSPKASIEGAKSRAYIGGGSESLFRDGKLEIILKPRASIKRESSEFFQVPKPIWKGGGYSSKASGKMKKYGGSMMKYEGKNKKYEGNMKEYMENMKEI